MQNARRTGIQGKAGFCAMHEYCLTYMLLSNAKTDEMSVTRLEVAHSPKLERPGLSCRKVNFSPSY